MIGEQWIWTSYAENQWIWTFYVEMWTRGFFIEKIFVHREKIFLECKLETIPLTDCRSDVSSDSGKRKLSGKKIAVCGRRKPKLKVEVQIAKQEIVHLVSCFVASFASWGICQVRTARFQIRKKYYIRKNIHTDTLEEEEEVTVYKVHSTLLK